MPHTQPSAHQLTSHFIKIGQHALHYLERKGRSEDGPRIILLHGFPENAHAWEPLIHSLPTHYHIIAPDLPGYHKSEVLSGEQDYEVPALVHRLSAFIKCVSNDKPVTLVAHDWGGAIAWPLAAFYPHLFHRLFILNAAHPSTFTLALIHSKVQRQKSQYIHTLARPGAEASLRNTDFSLLKDMLGEGLFGQPNEYAKSLLADWNDNETLSAMLSYYRQMPQTVPPVEASEEVLARFKIPNIRVTLPTCVLWGRQDKAFDESVLEGLDSYVSNVTVFYHDTATHWIHREQPCWVAQHIVKGLTDI